MHVNQQINSKEIHKIDLKLQTMLLFHLVDASTDNERFLNACDVSLVKRCERRSNARSDLPHDVEGLLPRQYVR